MSDLKLLIFKINQQIIEPIIILLFVLSLVLFFWGVVEYIRDSKSEDGRKTGQQHMLWGIVGIFVMVSAWAILGILLGSLGVPPPDYPQGLSF